MIKVYEWIIYVLIGLVSAGLLILRMRDRREYLEAVEEWRDGKLEVDDLKVTLRFMKAVLAETGEILAEMAGLVGGKEAEKIEEVKEKIRDILEE